MGRMGIYNRDYVTESRTARRSPSRHAVVTKIVCITIGVFLLQMLTGSSVGRDSTVFNLFALERDLVFQSGQIWRLLTYAFCHSETQLMHIVCNMLALFFVGRILAQRIGGREFLALYLTGAVFSGIVQVCSMAIYRTPGPAWALGASGAVSAVFVVFAMHFPRLRLYFFGAIPIQARWLLLLLVSYDVLGYFHLLPGVLVIDGAAVGHAAHLGGLIFGFLYFQWNMNLSVWWDRFAKRPRPSEDTSAPAANLRVFNPGFQPEVSYTDRMDDVLAKISRNGEASLTDRERRILSQASEHLNNRQ